jgi:hypothetical protein
VPAERGTPGDSGKTLVAVVFAELDPVIIGLGPRKFESIVGRTGSIPLIDVRNIKPKAREITPTLFERVPK